MTLLILIAIIISPLILALIIKWYLNYRWMKRYINDIGYRYALEARERAERLKNMNLQAMYLDKKEGRIN